MAETDLPQVRRLMQDRRRSTASQNEVNCRLGSQLQVRGRTSAGQEVKCRLKEGQLQVRWRSSGGQKQINCKLEGQIQVRRRSTAGHMYLSMNSIISEACQTDVIDTSPKCSHTCFQGPFTFFCRVLTCVVLRQFFSKRMCFLKLNTTSPFFSTVGISFRMDGPEIRRHALHVTCLHILTLHENV